MERNEAYELNRVCNGLGIQLFFDTVSYKFVFHKPAPGCSLSTESEIEYALDYLFDSEANVLRLDKMWVITSTRNGSIYRVLSDWLNGRFEQ
jgi:hypothetical protein